MKADELLSRLAHSLKQEIAPAISGDYAKTQAYMASVVLEKLSRQLASATSHEAANRRDLEALAVDFSPLMGCSSPPPAVVDALQALPIRSYKEGLDELIRALYAERAVLGETCFQDCLRRVRQTLRQGLDRELEFAA